MNLEVINKWLDEEYGCSYTKLEELHDFYFEKYCDLKQENKQLKDELKSKPDAQITLQDDKGNKFMIIQTERIDMQVELNKTIEKLFNNWNKLKKYINEANEDLYYTNNYDDILYIMQELEQGSDSNE